MDKQRPRFYTTTGRKWERLKPFVGEMRRKPTRAEDMLWQRVRNRQVAGAKFRRQQAIGSFIVDFVCIEHRLVIEVDGSIHDLPAQQSYDARRQAYLEDLGYRVVRFTNHDVLQSIESVVESIATKLPQAQLPLSGVPSGPLRER